MSCFMPWLFVLLVQLSELFGLSHRGGCLLAFNGHRDELLVFGANIGKLHGRHKAQPFYPLSVFVLMPVHHSL